MTEKQIFEDGFLNFRNLKGFLWKGLRLKIKIYYIYISIHTHIYIYDYFS